MKILKAVALGCVPLVAAFLCLLLWQCYGLVRDIRGSSTGIINKLDATLDHINRPCKGSGQSKVDNCGTLALAGQTMVNAGDLIKRSDYVENKETALLDTSLPRLLDGVNGSVTRLNSSLDHIDTAAADIHPLLQTTTERIQALSPIENNAAVAISNLNSQIDPLFSHANGTLEHADKLLSDPSIPQTLANVQSFTESASTAAKKSSNCIPHLLFKCIF